MALNQEKPNKDLTYIFILLLCFVAVLNALVNLFTLGGDEFVINLNNTLVIILAIGVTLVSALIMGQLVIENRKRYQWAGMLTGWIFWLIGEILWAVFSITGKEIPYPSWADLCWLIGYIPIGISLFAHIRSLFVKPIREQKIAIIISSIISILITVVYLAIPVFQSGSLSLLLETVVNLLFILFDLIILLLSICIIFSPQKGVYGKSWFWFSIGFALHSISNNIFLYADYYNLYYPELKVNLLSSMVVDYSYNLSYLFWFGGLFVLRRMLKGYQQFTVNSKTKFIPNTNVLFFVDKNGFIMHTSDNAPELLPVKGEEKEKMAEVLGVGDGEITKYIKMMSEKKLLGEQLIQVNSLNSEKQEAWISGIGIRNPQDELTGVIFLVRIFSVFESTSKKLNEYQISVLDNLLHQLGSDEESQVKQMLLDYYFTYLKAMFDCSVVDGGVAMSDAFRSELQTSMQKRGCKLRFDQDGLKETASLSMEELQKALPALFNTASQFMAKQSSERMVASMIKNINSEIDPSIHEAAKKYGVMVD